jgi:hypothetical protein
MNSINEKPWWQSRAIIGAIVVVAAQAARLAGFETDTALVTELVIDGATIAGAALAWVGRVRAERPISRKQIAPGIRLPERPRRQ